MFLPFNLYMRKNRVVFFFPPLSTHATCYILCLERQHPNDLLPQLHSFNSEQLLQHLCLKGKVHKGAILHWTWISSRDKTTQALIQSNYSNPILALVNANSIPLPLGVMLQQWFLNPPRQRTEGATLNKERHFHQHLLRVA